jgi:hypothetical protein
MTAASASPPHAGTRTVRRLYLTIFFVLCVLAILPAVPASAQANSEALATERWIGSVEGAEAHAAGGAILYDLHFSKDGTVEIEKSYGPHLDTETTTWKRQNDKIAFAPKAESKIPELAGITLTLQTPKLMTFAQPNGVTVNLRPSLPWLSWLHYAFFFAVVIFLGNELCRHSRIAAYTLFLVFPIVLIPLWMHAGFDGWFRWAKLYSSILGAAVFTLFRFNSLHRYSWIKVAVAAILAVNIFEAVSQDFESGALPNILNAIAGVLNIITISRWMGIKRDERHPHDMLWPGMTMAWIIAYDIWNITFVYLNFPNTVLFTTAILLAPTLAAAFVRPGSWLQARAYTLAIYMMYIFSFKMLAQHMLGYELTLPLPRSENIALALAAFSLASNVGYALLHFRWRLTGKAPTRLQIGQKESVIAA